MSTKTTITGGALILAGGLALAVYANTNTAALQNAKAGIVTKYVKLSQKALSSGDAKAAEKYAKQALATNPKNKEALGEYKKVILASCPKAPAPAAANTVTSTATPTAAPAAAAPATPKAEPEEEMGCI